MANSLSGSCSEATFDAKLGVFVLYVSMDWVLVDGLLKSAIFFFRVIE
jgi:hypothetical protein